MQKHNYDKKKIAFVQPITPIRVGESIKLSVNFFNMNGLVDVNSISWNKLQTSSIPQIPIEIEVNKIGTYEKVRICEIEEIYSDWVLFEYFYNINKKRIDEFAPYLFLKEVYCAGVDIITSKHIFIAKQSCNLMEMPQFVCQYFKMEKANGILPKSKELFGICLEILNDYQERTCEVQRKGLYHDMETVIRLRVGDTFIFYISGGD